MAKKENFPAGDDEVQSKKPETGLKKVILPIALGVGVAAALFLNSRKDESSYEVSKDDGKVPAEQERKKRNVLDLGMAAKRFEYKEQVEGENIIFHIGQIHSWGSLKIDRETGFFPWIVQSQKDIEILIKEAKRQGVDTVFLEGYDVESPLDTLHPGIVRIDQSLGQALASSDFEKAFVILDTLSNDYQRNISAGQTEDGAMGLLAYYILDRVRRVFAQSKEGETRKKLKMLMDRFEKIDLIQGDNAYDTVGAVHMLWIHGEIQLAPVDQHEARMAALELQRYRLKPDATPEQKALFEKRKIELNRLREDAMVRVVSNWMQENKKKRALLCLGNSHILRNNVERLNQEGGQVATGLVKFISQAAKDLVAQHPEVVEENSNEPGEYD